MIALSKFLVWKVGYQEGAEEWEHQRPEKGKKVSPKHNDSKMQRLMT